MKKLRSYYLLFLIMLSVAGFSAIGCYWNIRYYDGENISLPSAPPLATAMQGIHDKLYFADYLGYDAGFGIQNLSIVTTSAMSEDDARTDGIGLDISTKSKEISDSIAERERTRTYDFTTATDDYFNGACFIGDSRTVGLGAYSGIENAVFLCKSSLTIYDYEKPKLTYNDKKQSIKDILSAEQFSKIYLMLGINECNVGTTQDFFDNYKNVVEDIRRLQPDALIFIQGNLFVTERKSKERGGVTNERLAERDAAVATLANKRDIFYIDTNESSLCADGALVPEYTWDQVHIKAQYYPMWKEFLLSRAIIK